MKRNLRSLASVCKLPTYLVCLFLIAVLWLHTAEYASTEPLDPDLVLYFDYEEFKGDTVIEKSGRGYDGAINGKVTQSDDGKFGKAAEFASTSFLDLDGPNIADDDIPTEGMSIVAWINVKNVTDMAIFNARAGDGTWLVHPEARGDGNYRWLNRGPNPNRTIFDIRGGNNKAKEWIHYAGTYSRADALAVLYINGKNVGEEPARLDTPIAGDWDQGARVGYNIDNNRPFAGLMDDLNVWKRGLTEEEVNAIMNDGVEAFLAVEAQGKLATTWGKLKASK
ncbi:LamG domain-containing protein [Candidatus Poribacteria bacterium]|nr:LamG domain-containing protein [Candidatus Poribacteria bacterium]MYG08740.1 LamG domain-containing protein [Candidatus Poribacteria bacterium]MYK22547.1 LamG domain-containing protein [Candidatus Poribacteria bacterium]